MHDHVASTGSTVDDPTSDIEWPLLLRCTALTCYNPYHPWVWGQRDEASRFHHPPRRRGGRMAARGKRAAIIGACE